jgi:arylsulfatase A-like enzyme
MAERPNVLIVTTDQQRFDSLRCYGSEFVHTPNLDRLAAEGALLERAYCCNPVCMPSRASIFSGLPVARHGVWDNGVNLPDDVPLVSHRLAELGYRTHYVGKTHFQVTGGTRDQSREAGDGWTERFPEWSGPYYGFQSVELSIGHTKGGIRGHYGSWVREQVSDADWERYQDAEMRGHYFFGCNAFDWDLPSRLHNSTWVGTRAIDFLERHAPDRPFLLALGFQDPHHTHCVPRDLADRVDPAAVPPPHYREGELAARPPHYAATRDGSVGGYEFGRVTPTEAREGRAYYYTLVQQIDREVGRVLDALDRLGRTQDTLVVFTSDHGELLGDHGLWMKGPYPYEVLVRVPMLVRWPAALPAGVRTDAVFSHLDLVPTILAAVGAEPPGDLPGANALPLLRGAVDRIRDDALIEYNHGPGGMRLKTLVTRDRKLTWYAGERWGELGDLAADPREKRNLWDDPAHAGEKAALLGRILDRLGPLERRAPMLVHGA